MSLSRIPGRVVQFPTVNAADMPAALRWYAQAIEDGQVQASSAMLVLYHGPQILPSPIHLGATLSPFEVSGLLHAATLRTQGVAFNVGP